MSLLVLASASPRRIEMLQRAAVPHAVHPVDVDETPEVGESPAALVLRLSQLKADAAAARLGTADAGRPILGADTIVVAAPDSQAALLGKPPHEGAARQMLLLLSGATHQVVTGYHLRYRDPSGELCRLSRHVVTEVDVRPIAPAELDGYLR